MSGLMVCSQYVDDAALIEGRRFSRPKKKAATRRSAVDSVELDLYGEDAIAPASAIVDEDELLYGDTGNAIFLVEPTYWLILARDSGKIVIHSLPDMSIVYQFLKFGLMPEIVTDLMPDEEEKDKKEQGIFS
ncbi:hypothetical protein ANCDUO_16637 [Ancylostoma duodenale]|uniref:Uncharacterized protein n=1 Tax=Ancylostoma duodenale TaxID=51022 RepID=A0A0C2G885_9BILA|nr:hypothetical protein ANCDUO_16637 [Ancylostoma duodenale]